MKAQINQRDQILMTQDKRIKEMKQTLDVFWDYLSINE